MANSPDDPRIQAMKKIMDHAINAEAEGHLPDESFRKSLAIFSYLMDGFDKEFGSGSSADHLKSLYESDKRDFSTEADASKTERQKLKKILKLSDEIPTKFINAASEDASYQYHLHHFTAKELQQHILQLDLVQPLVGELKEPSQFGTTVIQTGNSTIITRAPIRLPPNIVNEIANNTVAEHHKTKFLIGTINSRIAAINTQIDKLNMDIKANPSDQKAIAKCAVLELAITHLSTLRDEIKNGNLPDLNSHLVKQILELKTDNKIQTTLQAPRGVLPVTLWGSTDSATAINKTADEIEKAVKTLKN